MKKKNIEAELELLNQDIQDTNYCVCEDIAALREQADTIITETNCQEEVQSDHDKRIRELEDTVKDYDKVLGDMHSRIDRLEYALYGMKNILVEKLEG